MSQNAENRPWLAGGSQKDLAAGGGSAATVAQPQDRREMRATYWLEPKAKLRRAA